MPSLPPSRSDHPAILHVRPLAPLGTTWEVSADEGPEALSRHATQFEAIALAVMFSRKSGAPVHVHDVEGNVRVLPAPARSSPPPARLTGT